MASTAFAAEERKKNKKCVQQLAPTICKRKFVKGVKHLQRKQEPGDPTRPGQGPARFSF